MKATMSKNIVALLRVLFIICLLPPILSIASNVSQLGYMVLLSSALVFIIAQLLGLKEQKKYGVYLSILSGAVFIQATIVCSGGYKSPFLFLLFIPAITYVVTGLSITHILALLYTPFMLYLTASAVVKSELAWIAYIVLYWILLYALMGINYRVISEREKIINTLEEKVNKDPLTAVFNRNVLDDFFSQYYQLIANETCSIIMVDIDGFKEYNDLYGHLQGDELLKKVAGVLRNNVRNMDLVIRFGGDEFLLILWGIEQKEARFVLERIERRVMSTTNGSVSGGLSSGIIAEKDDLLKLIDLADQQLYKRKYGIKKFAVTNN